MINLDQKYESYVRNGEKKLRIDGIQENYTLYYNRDEQFLRMEALAAIK